ncbi:hypothetical protein SDRG_12049 [Saprolegnia diclina VS20]|uniref:Uncharacterized protein n=1 Tax=Saprolegnia diclina (strain VS20) TaxID=1156394 RepID=T0RJV6_SAPDV|nr:hypothetical protein SDRG_12049 [Saprolegnia diclina VS20]EQC30197.1 hypothetical protein SDRG_12049 [Saprolegnia diclina VS20]|eukprot:XP_008616329.1 hypothetical protein SDRG_12049 [Saprolegnia diclina VS20]
MRAELVSAFAHLAHAVLTALTTLDPVDNDDDMDALVDELRNFLQVPTELVGVDHQLPMACGEATHC